MNAPTSIEIQNYNDNLHRTQVITLWKSVFGYKDARNDPALIIASKIVVDDNLFFVARVGDQVIGTVMAGYDGHRGWIYSLAVTPEMRMQSVGTRLLSHSENALKVLGCIKINLQILPSNELVKEFYIKNGYKIEERISMGKEIRENISLHL